MFGMRTLFLVVGTLSTLHMTRAVNVFELGNRSTEVSARVLADLDAFDDQDPAGFKYLQKRAERFPGMLSTEQFNSLHL